MFAVESSIILLSCLTVAFLALAVRLVMPLTLALTNLFVSLLFFILFASEQFTPLELSLVCLPTI